MARSMTKGRSPLYLMKCICRYPNHTRQSQRVEPHAVDIDQFEFARSQDHCLTSFECVILQDNEYE